jgi:hypothetical protein
MIVADYALSCFGPSDYQALLCAMSARGYTAVDIHNIAPNERHMFLRHDVDLCAERALVMSEIESALGVNSTYYFLISTAFYNLASRRGREILGRIASQGHAIGLHFDTTQYNGTIDEIEASAVAECKVLELLAGTAINSLSFHRPAPELLNRLGRYAGMRHTYEPAFFSDIAYVSDSNGGWHHGHPLEHSALQAGKAIQLLTHPIWWTVRQPTEIVPLMESFREERIAELTSNLAATVTAYGKSTNR